VWQFSVSQTSRLQDLANAPSFEAITQAIASSMTVLCRHYDRCDKNHSFCRAVYCVEVGTSLFDQFFNSAQGYRAQYFHSPQQGREANATFLRILKPRLLAAGAICDAPSEKPCESRVDPEISLSAAGAKVWLAEKSHQLCNRCGEWSQPEAEALVNPEIRNERWERLEELYAKWGCTAPYLTRIRVLGGFINNARDELLIFEKRFRAEEISRRGWS
jgi:hypothetical protein